MIESPAHCSAAWKLARDSPAAHAPKHRTRPPPSQSPISRLETRMNIAGVTASSHPLNREQLAAVRYVDGPLLVLAGAGSGKTRVITAKIAHLIDTGIAPKHIAAITFTNRAAAEMKSRAEKLLASRTGKVNGASAPSVHLASGGDRAAIDARDLTVCTFHSLGNRILRAEAKHAGLKSS